MAVALVAPKAGLQTSRSGSIAQVRTAAALPRETSAVRMACPRFEGQALFAGCPPVQYLETDGSASPRSGLEKAGTGVLEWRDRRNWPEEPLVRQPSQVHP